MELGGGIVGNCFGSLAGALRWFIDRNVRAGPGVFVQRRFQRDQLLHQVARHQLMIAQFRFGDGKLLLLQVQLRLQPPRANCVACAQRRIDLSIQVKRFTHQIINPGLQFVFVSNRLFQARAQLPGRLARIRRRLLGIETNARQWRAWIAPHQLVDLGIQQDREFIEQAGHGNTFLCVASVFIIAQS